MKNLSTPWVVLVSLATSCKSFSDPLRFDAEEDGILSGGSDEEYRQFLDNHDLTAYSSHPLDLPFTGSHSIHFAHDSHLEPTNTAGIGFEGMPIHDNLKEQVNTQLNHRQESDSLQDPPPSNSISHFSWYGISIPDIPTETHTPHLSNEPTASFSARALYQLPGLSPGNKRKTMIDDLADGPALAAPRLFSEPSTTSHPLTKPRNDPNGSMEDVNDNSDILPSRKKSKQASDWFEAETITKSHLVLNMKVLCNNQETRYTFFPQVLDGLIDSKYNPDRILRFKAERIKRFLSLFDSKWKRITTKVHPHGLASLGLTHFYLKANTWAKFYRDLLGTSELDFTERIKKLCRGSTDGPELFDHVVYEKLLDSLLAYFLFVDIISTIFPKPKGVDVRSNERAFFETAFVAFEVHTRTGSVPFEKGSMKKLPFIWPYVTHWFAGREDYGRTALMDRRSGRIVYQFRMFVELVFAHSVESLTSQIT
ncbi:hypothetical protein MJO28_008333 [Puccinia striiformis f. sp. tritici]|uniref:Uncharacterized protein n=4 Tax=Puccinia striiformis TaxID=27350 RepID=A0A0L0V384_9BASI|nr:hypothetical protein Pst134EA_015586 [Puccinia striiformis f. sp. tritici]KAI9602681.1 hypothetical protein H4Q26_001977 [Puccinia striiformis f. sp. tritici PST-130]KNE93742.1 hypothetical protein PSTG_12845 [Puccinia striiformis f. sp. tritici PST-78]POW09978.1 hypothetical protein PSTT_06436 [Puccinia striiformis]KAH9452745.1 hypothetical protein Pst134EB_016697 [Puccinia striiformis f. sp. tritici]KAH9463501.1 hypothetical protein Pst134EA_015586 [Puccinia striiformis f. sp. tritici]